MSAPALALPPQTGLLWFDVIDSTNEEARRRAAAGETGPLWIVAERQTDGRGRRGRSWTSGAGNLTATYLFAPELPVAKAAQLSFAAALAVVDMLDVYARGAARVKWPNDILMGGRKIAGILLESAGGAGEDIVPWLAIGIGVNLKSYPKGTPIPATSLMSGGLPAPPLASALEHLANALDHWRMRHAREGFGPLREAWLARAAGLGGPVVAQLHDQTIEGTFADLAHDGALILKRADGSEHRVSAGEVFFPA